MALGCSTNAIIHLIAMSRRAGHEVDLDDFDAGQPPPGDRQHPAQRRQYLMEDFYYAGGLPALLKHPGDLHLGAMTVNGRTLGENIAGAAVYNDDVIRPLDNPIYAEGRAGRAARQPRARRRGDQAQRLRAAAAAAHRPRAGLRRLPER
jgi:dihydroxyacid dehydratase/phosphogluconate dehydratase